MTTSKNEHIRCVSCRYAEVDENASDRAWGAVQCGNQNSEYYHSLLNISESGHKLQRVSWKGCKLGERRALR